jgi:5-methylcytosine-specific restriction endonuclease McrA
MAVKYLDLHKYLRSMKKQVLLLNQDSTPLNIITISKAFKLLSKDKVWVDETLNEYYEVISVSKIVKIPKVLILKYYVKLPFKRIAPTRKNIFKRDKYVCQYCGMDLCEKSATIDHIIPKSKGGGSTWTNMIASCKDCNLYKGNRSPKEARMEIKTKPKEPSFGFIFDDMLISFKKDKNA